MFNSVAFEVVIGLVFVYLLYSLFTTIIGEMVMTWLGIRARILRVSIERMLNDGYYKMTEGKESEDQKQSWRKKILAWFKKTWIAKWMLLEHPDFTRSFAGSFYAYPSIKYLSKVESANKGLFEQSKPAYISPDNFAETLLNMLKDKGSSLYPTITDSIWLIKAALGLKPPPSAIPAAAPASDDASETPLLRSQIVSNINIQPETAKHILDYLSASGDKEDQFRAKLIKWFNDTQDRANGWFKLKLRFILFILGFIIAVAFNVDSIKIAQILAKDKDARGQLVQMGIAFANDSTNIQPYIAKGGDTLHSRAIIDSGYARVKKDMNEANHVLGLGWDFSDKLTVCTMTLEKGKQTFKTDTAVVAQYLRNKDTAKVLMKDQADCRDSSKKILAAQRQLIQGEIINQLEIDTAVNELNLEMLKAKMSGLLQNESDLAQKQKVLDINIQIDSIKISCLNLPELKQKADSITDHKFVSIDDKTMADGNLKITGTRHYSLLEILLAILGRLRSASLIGFIITAIAVSLGAPFWFGLLNKLASLRGAGVKPEEKPEEKEKKETTQNT